MVVTARRAAEKKVFHSRACKDAARAAADKQAREDAKPERNCVHCGAAIPKTVRADARFCPDGCNAAAHNLKRANGRLPRGSGRRREIEKMRILERDGFRCHLCHRKFKAEQLTLDHIIPLSVGGPHEDFNLAAACGPCNFKKGNRPMNEQLLAFG